MTSRERKYHLTKKAKKALNHFMQSVEYRALRDELFKDLIDGSPFSIRRDIYTHLTTPDNADQMWAEWQIEMNKTMNHEGE